MERVATGVKVRTQPAPPAAGIISLSATHSLFVSLVPDPPVPCPGDTIRHIAPAALELFAHELVVGLRVVAPWQLEHTKEKSIEVSAEIAIAGKFGALLADITYVCALLGQPDPTESKTKAGSVCRLFN